MYEGWEVTSVTSLLMQLVINKLYLLTM